MVYKISVFLNFFAATMAFSTRDVGITVEQQFVSQALDPDYEGDTVAIFIGPQGPLLADFVELHCPLTRDACLNRFRKGGDTSPDIKKKFDKYVRKLDAGIAGSLRENNAGCVQDLTSCYTLTNAGIAALPRLGTEEALSIVLACPGQFYKGKDGGANKGKVEGASLVNCKKNDAYEGWCASSGPCPETCIFQQINVYRASSNVSS